MSSTPLLIILATTLIGAGLIAYVFRDLGYNALLGGALGGAAGAVGPLIFMLPINFCMFAPDPEARYTIELVDQVFGLILIGLGLLLTLWPLRWWAVWWSRRNNPLYAVQQTQQGLFKNRFLPFVFLAPTLIILALFLYYPSLDTFRLSTLLARLDSQRTAFVCVDNFTRLVSDQTYLNVIGTTLLISLAIVVIGLALSLLIATMAYQPLKGARIYRTLLIWPYAISPAVAGIIFLLLFNPTGGIINYFLNGLFGIKIGWLNDPAAAPWAVILASVWKSMGFNILFYIAGLQNVPKDLQEAAAIDGANALQRFRHVVIPLLSPITFFLVITNITYAFFDTFGTIDYLTGGGPLDSTTTLMYQVYELGIVNKDLGKAAAQSIVLFALVIGLTILQFRTQGRRVNYGA